LREGCPNIVLESLSSNTPVIASKVGAVPEMLKSKATKLGLMSEPNSVEDLAKVLTETLSMDWPKDLDFKWMDWQESANKIAEVLKHVSNKHKDAY